MKGKPQRAIMRVTSPHPGRVVDMNELRADLRVLNHAVRCFLECFAVHPVRIVLGTGMPTLEEYDRVEAAMLAFGVMNARINWDRVNARWVLG